MRLTKVMILLYDEGDKVRTPKGLGTVTKTEPSPRQRVSVVAHDDLYTYARTIVVELDDTKDVIVLTPIEVIPIYEDEKDGN